VTGGTQGIGWAVVQALADHGAQVYACGRTPESLALAEQARLGLPWAGIIHLAQCDVTHRPAVESWIGRIHQTTGRIDVLVNNAAYVQWDDVASMTIEQAERTMQVGYNGMVYTTKTVLPLMQDAGRGRIVNVGSIAGLILVGGTSAAYAATKAAVDTYSRILQKELVGQAVGVTLVRLGTVAGTDFFRRYVPNSRMAPLSRFLPALTPPDVAEAIVRALYRRQEILTLPRYLSLLYVIYTIAPRFSRWLAGLGGANRQDYGQVQWHYHQTDQPDGRKDEDN
jgi:NAD(P)-dependent dehydrogenase (short-subunit alcohol dehydrogenase family)